MTNRYEQTYLPDGRPAYTYRSAVAALTAALAATFGEDILNAVSPRRWWRLSEALIHRLQANGYEVAPGDGKDLSEVPEKTGRMTSLVQSFRPRP